MLTTKQVRDIMRDGCWQGWIYTNKVKDPSIRHVKCYYNPRNSKDVALLHTLKREAGADNVWVTKGAGYGFSLPGIVVRCVLG